jgi:hypothetical protein
MPDRRVRYIRTDGGRAPAVEAAHTNRRRSEMHPLGKGIAIATAVAAMMAAGELTAMAQDKAKASGVKCVGVNECKGKGACKSAQNDCKGKNACKGKGFAEMKAAADCTAKGGKVQN